MGEMQTVEAAPGRLTTPPIDIWGAKRNCHFINFDYQQGVDGCIMCQNVADSWYKNETLCHCYKSPRGSEYLDKCNEMLDTIEENANDINAEKTEKSWTDYYLSYAICDKFNWCP